MFHYNIFYTVGRIEYTIENYAQNSEMSFLAEQVVMLLVYNDMKQRGIEGKPINVRVEDKKRKFIISF